MRINIYVPGEGPAPSGAGNLETAAERARRFQAETFGGHVFAVSSADLIREAREADPCP